MSKKFHVTRIMSVLQSTAVKADTAEQAIDLSRKLKLNKWAVVDNKRRKNYRAEPIAYTS